MTADMVPVIVFFFGILNIFAAGFFFKRMSRRNPDGDFKIRYDFPVTAGIAATVAGILCIIFGLAGMLK